MTRESLALSHRLLTDTVDEIRKCFSDYETLPTKMQRAESVHVICGFLPLSIGELPVFTDGGAGDHNRMDERPDSKTVPSPQFEMIVKILHN